MGLREATGRSWHVVQIGSQFLKQSGTSNHLCANIAAVTASRGFLRAPSAQVSARVEQSHSAALFLCAHGSGWCPQPTFLFPFSPNLESKPSIVAGKMSCPRNSSKTNHHNNVASLTEIPRV